MVYNVQSVAFISTSERAGYVLQMNCSRIFIPYYLFKWPLRYSGGRVGGTVNTGLGLETSDPHDAIQ